MINREKSTDLSGKTVADLIEALKKYPPDAVLCCGGDDDIKLYLDEDPEGKEKPIVNIDYDLDLDDPDNDDMDDWDDDDDEKEVIPAGTFEPETDDEYIDDCSPAWEYRNPEHDIKCPNCEETFQLISPLIEHFENVECPECGQVFKIPPQGYTADDDKRYSKVPPFTIAYGGNDTIIIVTEDHRYLINLAYLKETTLSFYGERYPHREGMRTVLMQICEAITTPRLASTDITNVFLQKLDEYQDLTPDERKKLIERMKV